MLKNLAKLCLIMLYGSFVSYIPCVTRNFIYVVQKWFSTLLLESYHQKSLTWGKSFHEILLTCVESFKTILNHFNLHLGLPELIQICSDRYQSSYHLHSSSGFSFIYLNQFTHLANRVIMLFLAKILHLPPFSIYSHFLITPK